ncbi:MAG: hypothetical protein TEF_00310 [Rhizobiales bacterium NRL2]|jgi:phage FluMu gp28-like protein|nr:MAG: hypothetical protein TEF_00310 [Rhizobiales bacterium NRL2]
MSDSPIEQLIPKTAELPAAMKAMPRGDILLPYQARAVTMTSVSALLVIDKSRRIGLTWGMASHAALTAAAARGEGGMDVWYMGYDLEMAREFIDVVGMWARAFGMAAGEMDEIVLEDDQKDIKAFRVKFASGFEVVALPSVARALRGKQGLVILDEAAFYSDLAEVLKAAMALLMWGGSVIVVSTHNGVDNPFNQLIDEIRAGRRKGATLTITFDDAIAEGLYERICLVTGREASAEGREAWCAEIRAFYGADAAEELDCVPSTGAGSWIGLDDIIAAQHPEAGRPELYQKGLVFSGWDVARRRDLSVIAPFEMVGDVLWLREETYMHNRRFAEQYDEIGRMMRDYRVVRLAMDQTGMGEAVVEEIQARHGHERCEGVILSGPRRLDLATVLKERFENGTIRIPDSPEIRADLRAIKRVAGPTGAPRLVNDDTVHADIFWAYALAAAAAAEGAFEYGYEAVTDTSSGRAGVLGRRAEDDDGPPSLAGFARSKGAW